MSSRRNSGITKLMETINLSSSPRRGSDVGLPGSKGFYITPHSMEVKPTTTTIVTGATIHSPQCVRDSASRASCQLHVPPLNTERRGSTGNIMRRKGSVPHVHHLNPHHSHIVNDNAYQRRGSTPGDVLLFPRRDSRKFSTDSIDLNADISLMNGNKPWKTSQRTIVEEEVSYFLLLA